MRPRIARGGILVAGGGVAGTHVARRLGEATVVNPTVAELWATCPSADLVAGSVVRVDPDRRVAAVWSEDRNLAIAYAELVLALGPVGDRCVRPTAAQLGLPVDDRGLVQVDETLRVIGTPHVWALGDCVATPSNGDLMGLADRLARRLRGDERMHP